ncbi:PREDICTED: putative F-box protein At1g53360 [Camelina sativa]|uniref:F-box protein At1g53360 n=1 Tax=Camelina sativa TaxID=90675 RepID=A0ABM1QLK2_CAMSA|nr:PREDICTED: putative F-box protein At1g53360 [Camelina sativa]
MEQQEVREFSDLIPDDLLIDIFSRVSVKSLGRCRCVSELWEYILGRPDFTELFLTRAPPRLLFAFKAKKELYVFSSPQPQSPDDEISCLVATPYKRFPKYFPTDICTSQYGLVFLQHRRRKAAQVVCNPLTRHCMTLPKLKATGVERSYFGFDPTSKQFKVLCMTRSRYVTHNTHRILTLESGKRVWRTIQDPIPGHSPLDDDEICINGVLYYIALFPMPVLKIVCFDFRREKFGFIKLDKDMFPVPKLTLFNYKGKLGVHQNEMMELEKNVWWVLEDVGEDKWFKRKCMLPPEVTNMMCVGMKGTGEIVFTPSTCYLSDSFYILFFNTEKNTVRRIYIRRFEELKHHRTKVSVQIILDFVERM